MGVHIAKIPLKPLRSFLVAAIIVTGLTNYIYQTSSESCGFKEIHYKNIPILQPIHISCYVKNIDGLSVPYDKDWDIMPILLYMDGIHASARPVNVLIGFDHHFLNSCTIQLYAELGRLRGTLHSKFTIDGLANRHLTEDEIRRFIEQSDFIITKTGFQGYDFSNRQNDVVTRFMSARTPIKTFAMTDGSTVSLYSWGSEEGP